MKVVNLDDLEMLENLEFPELQVFQVCQDLQEPHQMLPHSFSNCKWLPVVEKRVLHQNLSFKPR